MNIKTTFLKTAIVLIAVFTFTSCDKDFETIGSNIIGEPGFNTALYDEALISKENYNLNPVQTNNLPVNLLGVYTDPFYGKQEASILTQLNLSTSNPNFGTNPVLDSVVLHIPYFYTELDAEEGDDSKKYELDSVYGSAPIKLSIIESNLFLNEFDPATNFKERQKYFSNMQPKIKSNLGQVLYKNDSFYPSADAVTVYGKNKDGDEDTLQLSPQMRIHLPTAYFQEKIIEKEGSAVLSGNNNFKSYMRGLYFKAEPKDDKGNLMILNINQQDAGITLYYTVEVKDSKDNDEDGDSEELIREPRNFKLNFGTASQPAINVNLFEQEVSVPDDTNIYLKGGEGAMAVINLFDGPDSDDDGISDELEFLRDSEWLINEANLQFFVNQDMASGNEPEHIYLYDLENQIMLTDYVLDDPRQPNALTSKSNQYHLGALEKTESGEGIKYTIRITNHINNLINKDSTNVKLGLVVSQNVNIISNSAVLNPEIPEINKIPTAAVVTPEGTILYGPEVENAEKQLKLRIYYTEPKE